jgi:hypothetical protein
MNHERFIEQLNLYIDRELSGDELREIEEAISASPERQRIYRQYCRMEHACQKLLTDEVKAPRPSIAAIIAAAQSTGGDVVQFEAQPLRPAAVQKRSDRNGWRVAFAGLAAACVAGVIYLRTSELGGGVIQVNAAPQVAVTAPSHSLVGIDDSANVGHQQGGAFRTVLVVDQANDHQAQPNEALNWIAEMQFAPIRRVELDKLEFHSAEPMRVHSLSAYAYPYPGLDDTPPLAETAAFQFQR